jgi:hypothetical protein
VLAGACIDQDTPVAPGAPPSLALSSQPLESLGELPPFIEIAREVPTFGGFWFTDQDPIVVALTDLADFQRVAAMIPRYLGAHQPSGGYVAMKVRWSFAELARFRAALRAPVFGLAGAVSLGVKESANRVEIGVSSTALEPAVRGIVQSLGVADDAVAVLSVPVPQATSHTLTDRHPDGAIEGGWEIGISGCTLGFPAFRSDGSPVFVINSHCTQTSPGFDGGPITQGGVVVGAELLDPPGWPCGGTTCRHSDAALISAFAPLSFGKIARTTERVGTDISGGALTIDHLNPTFTISSRRDYVYENETREKVGRVTGWSYGAVEDTCTDHEIGGWVRRCSDRVDFAVQGGDSGSPVFYWKPDGTAELVGIVFGWEKWPYNDALMSNLHQVALDLGYLSVHAVIATIDGPTLVPPNSTFTWSAVVSGGKAPYIYSWYRDGALVSTASSYTGNTESADFQLQLNVSDALGGTSSDTKLIRIQACQEIIC